ncbi:MAG: hypothetical protein NE330_11740 [Lentisphaeraceae bacterium]|nr:hypothetical protein [Lentisphaeraceae bacterium]
MVELLVLLAYFGAMIVPLIVIVVLEYHASGIIEKRHHLAILRFMKKNAKLVIYKK